MALSEPLSTAVPSCTHGACIVGLLDEAAAWHPNGSRGGLKESWVKRLQGFPEQGWRSAVTPVDKLLSPCMPQ